MTTTTVTTDVLLEEAGEQTGLPRAQLLVLVAKSATVRHLAPHEKYKDCWGAARVSAHADEVVALADVGRGRRASGGKRHRVALRFVPRLPQSGSETVAPTIRGR